MKAYIYQPPLCLLLFLPKVCFFHSSSIKVIRCASLTCSCLFRNKMIKNWGVIGGIAAAIAAGVYVLWGPITERKKKKRGMVPGLLNLGNTCFLNSLLQGLAACPSFIRWLEKFSGSPMIQSCKDNQLSTTLLQLLNALSSDQPAEEDVLDAGCLLDVLRLYRWHISSFEEQDAHELFHVLTSSLEEERDRQPKVAHLFDMQSLESIPDQVEKAMTCRSRAPLHPIPSPWKSRHPFHGRLTSNMSCKRCEQQSPVRYDSFESLSLSIPLPQWGRLISLDQCLQHFISSETIKDVECENCTKLQQGNPVNGQVLESQRTTFIKQLKLGKLPQCLCIHLQRLTWSSEGTPIKRQEHVQFTEHLWMDRYKHNASTHRSQRIKCAPNPIKAENSDGSVEKLSANGTAEHRYNNNKPFTNGTCSSVFLQSPGVNLTYDYSPTEYLFQLTAVLVHHGDMHSGHFVTYRRSPPSPRTSSPISSQWLWVSDDSVRKASQHEVLSSNAYLLFYERVRRLNLALHLEE
ncbi:ubiquitin carboxyl-terminal hydrolase 30 isoform X2 [Anarrhichthys ocellatus]|uniref:ubiquitin carboxyl-terminal hydrolase 30 isoform X2 n=1 Tax=Anarrhichthys ocellatus TaxID=433405 RepID=UPI0012ED4E4A|nr:ubiquitin carboxyl-terminal hydrolase 30 isoform X2 [Anarrhichthys ocellatus]